MLRDSLIRGEWRDSLVFALLEEEWRAFAPPPVTPGHPAR
jgi:RimJ/RimL family protein N-acetyltransferase